eukprot:1424655-Prymnesium_polylepis.1
MAGRPPLFPSARRGRGLLCVYSGTSRSVSRYAAQNARGRRTTGCARGATAPARSGRQRRGARGGRQGAASRARRVGWTRGRCARRWDQSRRPS